jgi:hypothetical protein
MRQTVVPAQIITVEDKIIGNLSMQQLGLLLAPLFLGIIFFVMLPPNFKLVLYKLAIVVVAFIICGTLAIRIQGKVVFYWLILLFSYRSRPRFHVYDRSDLYLRRGQSTKTTKQDEHAAPPEQPKRAIEVPQVAVADAIKITDVMNDPRARLRFVNKKGKLHVVIQEIK